MAHRIMADRTERRGEPRLTDENFSRSIYELPRCRDAYLSFLQVTYLMLDNDDSLAYGIRGLRRGLFL